MQTIAIYFLVIFLVMLAIVTVVMVCLNRDKVRHD